MKESKSVQFQLFLSQSQERTVIALDYNKNNSSGKHVKKQEHQQQQTWNKRTHLSNFILTDLELVK